MFRSAEALDRAFKKVCGCDFQPYQHQLATGQALSRGKSVLLRAPTGSGKSEAVLVPFLAYEDFPKQMIYSLPLRTLVDDLASRFGKYCRNGNLNIRVAGHHGRRLEASLFYAQIVITTIDQTIGAYACTPLSLPVRHGNIPAGAVSSAFLVFDEVHTFEPLLALQGAMILAEHSHRLGLPFVFMSATMPDSFLNYMKRQFNAEVIDASEDDIAVRRNRELTVHSRLNELLNSEKVVQICKNSKKVIVVCNTVSRAQALRERLRGKVDPEPILLHSRFLDDDRARKENVLKEVFGKKDNEKAILIATQVIEVGLDITCDDMISEVAPIDALIQRAGRCARKGGKGDFWVFNVDEYPPYDKNAIEETKKRISLLDGKKLDWSTEKALVNQLLGDGFNEYLKPEKGAAILNQLAEGAFYGNRKQVEDTVRDALSCEVSIHNDPIALGSRVFGLERIRIQFNILARILREGSKPLIWEVDTLHDDDRIRPLIREVQDIRPYCFYVVHPDYASYDYDTGLILDKKGSPFGFLEQKRKNALESTRKRETWIEHAENTLSAFRDLLLPSYNYVLAKFAESWRLPASDLLRRIEYSLVLHDVGKLNREWQKGIGARNEALAHSSDDSVDHLPAHATVSAYALSNIFYEWGSLGDAVIFSVAHHHSVRAQTVPAFRLIPNWRVEIASALKLVETNSEISPKNIIPEQANSTSLPQFPLLKKERMYRTYCLISRLLRFADRIATAGDENSLLKYEEWYGG